MSTTAERKKEKGRCGLPAGAFPHALEKRREERKGGKSLAVALSRGGVGKGRLRTAQPALLRSRCGKRILFSDTRRS